MSMKNLMRDAILAEREADARTMLPQNIAAELQDHFATTPHAIRCLKLSVEVPYPAMHRIITAKGPQKKVYVDAVAAAYRKWRRQVLRFAKITINPVPCDVDSPEFARLEELEKKVIVKHISRSIRRRELDAAILDNRAIIEEILAEHP